MSAPAASPFKSDYTPVTAPSVFSEYLTRAELAQGLRKTVRSIDRLILHGEAPPFVQVGNTKLFRREAVAQWLRSRETPVRHPQSNGRRRGKEQYGVGQPRTRRNRKGQQ